MDVMLDNDIKDIDDLYLTGVFNARTDNENHLSDDIETEDLGTGIDNRAHSHPITKNRMFSTKEGKTSLTSWHLLT